jgi:hypothetical protein
MEDRETPRMRKYEESKTTQIMMATVRHVTSSSGLRKFKDDGNLSDRVYITFVPSANFIVCAWLLTRLGAFISFINRVLIC